MVRFAYLGTHPIGVDILRRLVSHTEVTVSVVVTYPPQQDTWWPGSVYRTAEELECEVLPLSDERSILDYEIDYILSVYYPNILDNKLLVHPDQGALNLHLAELPRYRGSNVFAHSIMNARADDHWRHGTTIHFMTEELDEGDIVDRRFVEIREDDTARDLYERTSEESLALFDETLPKIVSGEIHNMRTPQETFEGKRYFYTKDSLAELDRVDPERLTDPETALETCDQIRALDFPPHDPAYTELGDRRVYLIAKGYTDIEDST